jgi:hypothetical protein
MKVVQKRCKFKNQGHIIISLSLYVQTPARYHMAVNLEEVFYKNCESREKGNQHRGTSGPVLLSARRTLRNIIKSHV